MLPTLVLVGRPNVGKSTLFNRLTGTRDALVHDMPGMTRDRHYGRGRIGGKPYLVVDTGGLEPVAKEGIMAETARQTLQAIDEADAIIFMVDARSGLSPQDKVIAERLRLHGRGQPVLGVGVEACGVDEQHAPARGANLPRDRVARDARLGMGVLLRYGLSRSKSTQSGSILLVYSFTLFAFVLTGLHVSDFATTLYGMIPIAYVLAGVLLSVEWQIVLVILVLAGSIVLGRVQTVLGINMNLVGGNLVALGAILVFTSKLRDGIERRSLDPGTSDQPRTGNKQNNDSGV